MVAYISPRGTYKRPNFQPIISHPNPRQMHRDNPIRLHYQFPAISPCRRYVPCHPGINSHSLSFKVFSSLRVHALARSWLVSSLVLVLSNAPMVVNYVSEASVLRRNILLTFSHKVTTFGIEQATGSPDEMFGCVEVANDEPDYWGEA